MTYDENSVQCYHIGIYLTGWGYRDEWLGSGDGQNKVQAGVAAAADALKRDGPILKDAIRQKNELRAARLKEQEEKGRTEGVPDQHIAPAAEEQKVKTTYQDSQLKKRKKEEGEEGERASSEKKKKHRKERNEKKH